MTRMSVALILVLGLFASGCTTPRRLQKNTVNQAGTVADIYEQQVLDNLAKFVCDPYALPFFAFPTQGTSDVTDTGKADFAVRFIPSGFGQADVGADGTRQAKQNWTMTPITDPRKLELMRCAYQRAIACCGYGDMLDGCPNCDKRFKAFYTGDAIKGTIRPAGDGKDKEKYNGTVTSKCLNGFCWFYVGCSKCCPTKCNRVGRYCGMCVWVPPGAGRNELSKLTLAILDYAVNDPSTKRKKTIRLYLDDTGVPVGKNSRDHAQTFEATVPIDLTQEQIRTLLAIKGVEGAVFAEPAEVESLKMAPPSRTPNPSSGLLQLEQRLGTVR